MKNLNRKDVEYYVWLMVPVMMLALYYLFSFVLPATVDKEMTLLGLSQFQAFGLYGMLGFTALVGLLFVLFVRYELLIKRSVSRLQSLLHYNITAWVIALAGAVIFFLLRNNFLNQDALLFPSKFERYLNAYGSFATHDEMWEFFIHSKLWAFTNAHLGWDVFLTYQVISSIAGGFFLFILIKFAQTIAANKELPFLAIMLCGGYMQLFFGDVENYTLTAVFVLLYFYVAFLYVEHKVPLLIPSLTLTVALTFHLLTGFLLPSLLWLYILELKKRNWKPILLAFGASVALFLLTLLFFHFNHLPIQSLYTSSNASLSGGHLDWHIVIPSVRYYQLIVRLLLLLVPFILFLPLLLLFNHIKWNNYTIFLSIAVIFMLLFTFEWKALLGVLQDWNLFANSAIPISILIAYNYVHNANFKGKYRVLMLCLLLFGTSSYLWIILNHFR